MRSASRNHTRAVELLPAAQVWVSQHTSPDGPRGCGCVAAGSTKALLSSCCASFGLLSPAPGKPRSCSRSLGHRAAASALPAPLLALHIFPLLAGEVAADPDPQNAVCFELPNSGCCENADLPRQWLTYICAAARRRSVVRVKADCVSIPSHCRAGGCKNARNGTEQWSEWELFGPRVA